MRTWPRSSATAASRARVEEHLVSNWKMTTTRLLEAVPAREAQLETLLNRPEVVQRRSRPRRLLDRSVCAYRVKSPRTDIDGLKQAIRRHVVHAREDSCRHARSRQPSARSRTPQKALIRTSPASCSALTLSKARARVDAVTWVPIELTAADALETARANRRDWANARAQLVDIWRLIEYTANALKAGLNVTLQGDLATTGDNPLNFRGSAGGSAPAWNSTRRSHGSSNATTIAPC
jgi:hypothetical protein